MWELTAARVTDILMKGLPLKYLQEREIKILERHYGKNWLEIISQQVKGRQLIKREIKT